MPKFCTQLWLTDRAKRAPIQGITIYSPYSVSVPHEDFKCWRIRWKPCNSAVSAKDSRRSHFLHLCFIARKPIIHFQRTCKVWGALSRIALAVSFYQKTLYISVLIFIICSFAEFHPVLRNQLGRNPFASNINGKWSEDPVRQLSIFPGSLVISEYY